MQQLQCQRVRRREQCGNGLHNQPGAVRCTRSAHDSHAPNLSSNTCTVTLQHHGAFCCLHVRWQVQAVASSSLAQVQQQLDAAQAQITGMRAGLNMFFVATGAFNIFLMQVGRASLQRAC